MKNIFWIFAALLGFTFVACSEDKEVGEFDGNWKERNEAYIDSIALVAKANEGSQVGQWRVLQSYHLSTGYVSKDNQEYVFAKILRNGEGKESPLYTDSVTVNYRGHLIPTASYPKGLVFDQNYYGEEMNPDVMVPSGFYVDGVVEGWRTALQYMREGDIWQLYVPQKMGYGAEGSGSSIPGYSTLIFIVYLRKVTHK